MGESPRFIDNWVDLENNNAERKQAPYWLYQYYLSEL